jgi:general secretion pathway protein E
MHAALPGGALQNLRAWGVHPHFLANCLLGVVNQRLVRTLCPECRSPSSLADRAYLLGQIGLPAASGWEGQSLWSAQGCPGCHGSGYSGRTGVFEVLRVSPALRRLIAEGESASRQYDQAIHDGLVELRRVALLKITSGETTAEEVFRAMPSAFPGEAE